MTGAVAAVRHDDYIITAYRDHAHALARGPAPTHVWRSFLERKQAVRAAWAARCISSTGKITCRGSRHRGRSRSAGGWIGFAIRDRGEDRVTLCFFGDGAINQGAFHEALNLYALIVADRLHLRQKPFAMETSVKLSTCSGKSWIARKVTTFLEKSSME